MIPLSVPNLSGNEWKYIKDCLDSNWVSSVGSYVNKFESEIVNYSGAKYAVATSNGTAALHISLILLNIGFNDYVLVPNLTFVAPVNAIKYTGANPILIDVDPDTWQIDLNLLQTFLERETENVNHSCVLKATNRTIKAIMPVHVYGNMCDMNRLIQMADEYHLEVIEDATESLGSKYNGKHAGTFGTLGCLSFNGNKIITTGGGGMIITNNKKLAKKAKHITTQAKSNTLQYIHDETGYNYRLVNILAAMGVAQLEQLPGFIQKKKEITSLYKKKLTGIEDIQFQQIEKDVEPNFWLTAIGTSKQKELLTFLNKNNIESKPLWVPMNQLPMFADDSYITNHNVSNELYNSCVCLPCSTNIVDEDIEFVCQMILSRYKR